MIGLNEKLTVFNDIKHDLETNKQMLAQSEEERVKLQKALNAAAVKMQEQAYENKAFQDTIISENKTLKEKIQQMEVQASLAQKSYLEFIKKLENIH